MQHIRPAYTCYSSETQSPGVENVDLSSKNNLKETHLLK